MLECGRMVLLRVRRGRRTPSAQAVVSCGLCNPAARLGSMILFRLTLSGTAGVRTRICISGDRLQEERGGSARVSETL